MKYRVEMERLGTGNERSGARGERSEQRGSKRMKKQTEYGKQLSEKQKVKEFYGLRERQFKRFFSLARRSREATGELLLSLLERRLDNVVFRLKLTTSRQQARQIIVHGHILVNGKKVSSPSYLVAINDEIGLSPRASQKEVFVKEVVDKRLSTAAKTPDWLELDKKNRLGKVLRHPVRTDIQMPIEEHLIVELYSK
jgi:small subunit ribosomal protein S4